ncbi:MAG: hypothetical protein ACFB9M_01210 [Myxococcota bacterium]
MSRRAADERQFQIFFCVGFLLLLPMVAVNRCLPGAWSRRRLGAAGARTGLVAETSEEVRNILAFVFMA